MTGCTESSNNGLHYLSKIFRAYTHRTIVFDIDLIEFTCQDLTYRKISNWLRTEAAARIKPYRAWGYPTIIQVEPTNFCNLKCPVCPSVLGTRKQGKMDFKLFSSLVEDLQEYLLAMLFWDWGEPFLHPDAYEMIRLVTDRGIKVMASTNGHLFADVREASKVVDSNLDVLVFSIDGTTQHSYQQFRRNGNLDTVLQGLKNVLAERKRMKRTLPLVNLRFIVNRHNEQEIDSVKQLAGALSVDVLTLRKFHSVSDFNSHLTDTKELIPRDTLFQIPLRDENDGLIQAARNPCKNLWNCPTVHWNGTVCSCFMDYNGKRPLGNLNDSPIHDIWFGAPYQDLRKRFRQNWRDDPFCSRCSNGYVGGDIGREANAEAYFFNEVR